MLHAKCLRCRRGDMFTAGIYNFRSNKILDHCAHCNLHFEIEPGYFFAAMYISYALSIAEALIIVAATYLLTHNSTSPWLYIAVLLTGNFLLAPVNFKYSRVLLCTGYHLKLVISPI